MSVGSELIMPGGEAWPEGRNAFHPDIRETFNDMADAIVWMQEWMPILIQKALEARAQAGADAVRFPAVVTANETEIVADQGRWLYEVTEAQMDTSDERYATLTEPIVVMARNRWEAGNTSRTSGVQLWGVDLDALPTGTTASIDPVRIGFPVEVVLETDSDGGPVYWFEAPNPLAISCE